VARGGPVIEIRGLTMGSGPVLAVDALNFVVRPGPVTWFLGPNGSGGEARCPGSEQRRDALPPERQQGRT